jgi:hypothetical protein
VEWRKTHVGRTDLQSIVHADNTGRHIAKKVLDFLEQNGMKNAPHPLCWPDLAPSDFYLFGYVKQLLAGQEFPDRGAILDAVQDIMRVIGKVTLDQVFPVNDPLCGCHDIAFGKDPHLGK